MSNNASDRYEAMQTRAGTPFVVHISERSPWTVEFPTQEGFYWYRPVDKKTEPQVRLIVFRDGEYRVCQQHNKEFGTPLKFWKRGDFEWAGPFFPPK
jgi:hypothetical protein